MKKLLFASIVSCFSMFGFSKEIPVVIHDCGTNVNFNVNGGKINVIFEGTVIDKEYDSVEINIAEPQMENCTIAYTMTITSGDRYCEILINCKASDGRTLRFDEVISQMTESKQSKQKFIVDAIENYFKLEEVVWLKKPGRKEA